MKTEIQNKVKALVDTYRTVNKELTDKIKAWEKDTVYADAYKQAKIGELKAEAKSYDSTFNEKLHKIITEEKDKALGKLETKSDDYQMQISNALEFIKLGANNLTDDQTYSILKPFQNDPDTMQLFQSVVGNLVHGESFEKTFGKTNRFMTIVNSFGVAENTSDNLFDSTDNSLTGAIRVSMFMDSIETIQRLVNAFDA